MSTLKY